MTKINKSNSRFEHVFAVVRIDFPVDQNMPENSIAIVKVFGSEDLANAEILRLNKVNKNKGCKYVSYITRFIT